MKLGTRAERLLAKHIHEVAARPERYLREPRLTHLEPYMRGIAAAFRLEHGRDPFSDSPWNTWQAFELRRGFGRAGAFVGLSGEEGAGVSLGRASSGRVPDAGHAAAFRRFAALFNRFRAWAAGRACTALLEDARTAGAVRRFLREEGAKATRARFAARQYVAGSARRFDAVVFRAEGWLEDEADGRDNRMAIAILDGGA
jgi:hypothetical protein